MPIVELGVFMGAGTYHLARGARDGVVVHGFDRFLARSHEIKIAAEFGVKLRLDEDTLPRVLENLAEYVGRFELHKALVTDFQWNGPQIGLHVDDVCKRGPAFTKALAVFAPYWIPGKTVVVLMDYWFFKKHPKDQTFRFQHEFMTRNARCFQHIEAPELAVTSAEAFLYVGGLNVGPMRRAVEFRTICEVLREINDLHQGSEDEKTRALLREAVDMAKRMSRKLLEYNKEAFKDWWADNPDYEADALRRINEDYLG